MIIKGILTALTVVFAILGISETIHTVRLICFSPHKKSGAYSVLILNPQRCVEQILFAKEQLSWLGNDFADCVFAVTDAISDEQAEECRSASHGADIVLLKLCELEEKINETGKGG